MLNPLLDELEDLLDKGCTLEGGTATSDSQPHSRGQAEDKGTAEAAPPAALLTWENVQLGELPGLFRLACKRQYQFGSPESIAEAMSGMLSVLHAISVAGERAEVGIAALPTQQQASHHNALRSSHRSLLICTTDRRTGVLSMYTWSLQSGMTHRTSACAMW